MKTAILTEKQIENLVERGFRKGVEWAISFVPTNKNTPICSQRKIYDDFGHSNEVKVIMGRIAVRNGNTIKVNRDHLKEEFFRTYGRRLKSKYETS